MRDAAFEQELCGYYKQVRRLLVGSRGRRDKMMQALTGDVDAFLEGAPAAEIEAVQAHFGAPQKLGDEMVAAMEPRELRRYMKRIKVWNWFVAAFIVITVLVAFSMQLQKVLYAVEDRENIVIGPPVIMEEKDMPTHNVIQYVQQ